MKVASENSTNERATYVTSQYFSLLDKHLHDLIDGQATEMYELNDIAKILCVSPKHLIKLIQKTSGYHPCHFYVQKILETTKQLLLTTNLSISEIAFRLTYDPSNFTKFFKKYEKMTPSQFRSNKKAKSSP